MKPFFKKLLLLLPLLIPAFQSFGQQDSLRYKVDDLTSDQNLSNLDFSELITQDIQYNPKTGQYDIVTKIGEIVIDEQSMDKEEYEKYSRENNVKKYWKERVEYDLNNARSIQEPDMSQYLDTTKTPFFDVKPFGGFDLTLGYRHQNIDNPTVPVRQRKDGNLDFDMNIQMGVNGSIAERLNFDATYNTESNFTFDQNRFSVGYQGKDDDILKEVEFGNVALPLRSSLIQGNQSLLGVKSSFQFGRLKATAVLSQQKSNQQGITLQGGAQKRNFEIKALEYEENRHFFLAHYFRDQYEDNLNTLPALNTPYNITRLQVWVTNRNFQPNNIRQFVAFTDLGEPNIIYNGNVSPVPGAPDKADNGANTLYSAVVNGGDQARQPETAPTFLNSIGLQETRDYELITARMLAESEYTFNQSLGYISLNRSLAPDEVLGIAFEYTDLQGNVLRVGEFAENVGLSNNNNVSYTQDQLLVLKLLKPRAPRTDLPTWDLMMKNIYSLGAFQINKDDFRLDVYYNDPGDGLKRYLPVEDTQPSLAEIPLIRLLKLDRFNASTVAIPDGVFDFLPGYTINPQNGRLIFSVLEPFGDYLREQLVNTDDQDRLAFDELYNLTKTQAEQYPEFNRFSITGHYKSEVRDEISLGAFNIPQGSVTVRAGGRLLIENIDYTIDYPLGRIKIINPALVQSGVPLDIKFENNLQFGFQSQRLAGTRLDYFVNDKLSLGGTLLNLRERPFTNKVNLGDDPINNTVLGADLVYETKSPWLTRMVDLLPFLETKAESSVNLQAEFARFSPGHSNQIGKGEGGQVYIDDFEGASATYDLKFPPQNWVLSSTPRRFPEATLLDDWKSNYNRGKLSWYNIDPLLNSSRNKNQRPPNIDNDEASDVYARQVLEREIFPNIVNEQQVTLPLVTLDVSYYPNEPGPYNFNIDERTADGKLLNPESKWGGIMREVNVTDFQAANVEFIEFWLMDPFIDTERKPMNSQNKGKLVFNLGNISEDILKDGRKFFENGLPEPNQVANLDTTNYSLIPNIININNAFSASDGALLAQDVGFDGMNNEQEALFFETYLTELSNTFGNSSEAVQRALADPAGDDFHSFLGSDYDAKDVGIVDRYKDYNNPHGNSSSTVSGNTDIDYNSSNFPDTEDVNRDNTLERTEAYYEYEIDLSPTGLQVGQNFIVSKVETDITLQNGSNKQVDWYQFKIPIEAYKENINNLQGFQSIRFLRMYLTEFEHPTTLRFARLNLLRNQWRRYQYEFEDRNDPVDSRVSFNVFPVNIEENEQKQPYPYVLPPGIQREEIQGAANSFLRNEQSLALNICALPDGRSRGIYKLANLDIRLFDKLKMFVHAESLPTEQPVDNDDFELIVRVGSDFSDNFYEYKQPLYITTGAPDRFSIWPDSNNIEVGIQDWIELKRQRNSDANAQTNEIYYNSEERLGVIGTPDLGRTSFIMIAVRNKLDDKQAKCVEVWVNELRLSGLNEESANAALMRADFQLADFGGITFSGNMHTAGYGSLEKRIDDRNRDDFVEFDISGNFNLDKFLPSKSTFKLPVYAGFSKSTSLPQYNPYESDLKLSEEPDSVQDLLREEVEIKTINFTNIRKERKPNSERNPKVYDVENLNLSYSYTERNMQTAIISKEKEKTHYGALGYAYNPKPRPIRPFYTLIQEQKYLQWLKEVNFNLIPTKLGFRTDMRSIFEESTLRDIQEPSKSLEPYFFKDWVWNRNYDLGWKLSNSINLDFRATNQSRIDQPDGIIDTQFERDSIWNNVKHWGRNELYNHNASLTVKLPFDKFPILDFITSDVDYSTTYRWLSAPQELVPNTNTVRLNPLGNAIENSQGIQANANLDFNRLYNKSNFLKQYNGGATRTRARPQGQRPQQPNQQGNKQPRPSKEATGGGGMGFFIKPLISIKKINATYSDQRGTLIPGFTETPTNFGVNVGTSAPGWGFVFGKQPHRDWLFEAADKDWITKDTTFSYQYNQSRTRQFTSTASLIPWDDLNIDLNLNYSRTNDYNELFRNTGTEQNPLFQHINPYRSGAFDISYISMKTIFSKIGEDDIPQVFRDFENNRVEASRMFAERNPNSQGQYADDPTYYEGYGPYAQEVIMSSFVAAYSGKSVQEVELDPFNTKPLPNWKVSYNGLTSIPFLAKYFSTIRLNHAYSGNFSINQYNSNLKYEGPEDYFLPTTLDSISNNFYAFYYIPQVLIRESFSPLAGIDLSMNNGFTMRTSYTKSRTLGMSLLDYQLSENNSTAFIIGAGYQTKNFKLPFFKFIAKNGVLENDLRFNFDYGLQDDVVINYKLDQDTILPTQGAKTVSIFPTIDYTLNQRMNVQFYYNYRKSEPKTRNSYPVKNNRGGLKLSYTFGR